MSGLAKTIITAIIVVVAVVLTVVITGSRNASGYTTPGVLAIAILAGAIGGIRAVWRKQDK